MSKRSRSLEDLRDRIDDIDARIHDALRERAAVVKEIGDTKDDASLSAYQPAREARLLRRLLTRPVDGVDRGAVFGIWREIVAVSTRIQGDFSVAVLRAAGADMSATALQHFGCNHTVGFFPTPVQVLDAVASRESTVGVLPHWGGEDTADWWRHLVRGDAATPRIVARLPFLRPAVKGLALPEAFVVAIGDSEPSGDDRSLFVLDGVPTASRASVNAAAERVGLRPREHQVLTGATRLHFLDIDGYVGAADAVVKDLTDAWPGHAVTAIRVGGYATPVGKENG